MLRTTGPPIFSRGTLVPFLSKSGDNNEFVLFSVDSPWFFREKETGPIQWPGLGLLRSCPLTSKIRPFPLFWTLIPDPLWAPNLVTSHIFNQSWCSWWDNADYIVFRPFIANSKKPPTFKSIRLRRLNHVLRDEFLQRDILQRGSSIFRCPWLRSEDWCGFLRNRWRNWTRYLLDNRRRTSDLGG